MERRTFLKGLLGAAAVATLPASWMTGPLCRGQIRVAHPEYFFAKDVIHIPRTGENMIVTSKSKNLLSVVRGLGTSKEVPLVDQEPVWILGSMEPVDEKEGIPAPLSFPAEGLIKPEWQSTELLPNIDVIEAGS